MSDLCLHEATRGHLTRFVTHPSHALLLTGTDGVGKRSVAERLISEVLSLAHDRLASYAHFSVVAPDEKGTISIESVRGLAKFLQLKTIGTNSIRRAVLIEDASGMSTEAQNAFLKILEEPPSDTLIVLTAESPRNLLPTMLSRVQTIAVQAPEEKTLKAYFAAQGHTEKSITQAYFLSGGLPGLSQALLVEQQDHPLLAGVIQAKELLRQSSYERLCGIDSIVKQKETIRSVLQALLRIAQTGLHQAANKQDITRLKQWHRIRKETLKASQALDRNGNSKLVLSNLFLHI